VDLPEISSKLPHVRDFAPKFTHVSERASRVSDLSVSICAVLIAEACNIGLEPLVRADVPALQRTRLSWVNQNFLRNETLTGANACLRQRYREGQEDQLGALGLVVNIIVLWNTIYIDAALQQLRTEGFPVKAEDLARLSPLVFDHIKLLGRYSFSLPDSVQCGQLRPLRNPSETTEEAAA
jgi:hypothetical protein